MSSAPIAVEQVAKVKFVLIAIHRNDLQVNENVSKAISGVSFEAVAYRFHYIKSNSKSFFHSLLSDFRLILEYHRHSIRLSEIIFGIVKVERQLAG